VSGGPFNVGDIVRICVQSHQDWLDLGWDGFLAQVDERDPGRTQSDQTWLVPLADRPDVRRRDGFNWSTENLTLVRPAGTFEPGDIVSITDPLPHHGPTWTGFRAQVLPWPGRSSAGHSWLKPLDERPDGEGFAPFMWTRRLLTIVTPDLPSDREESSEMTATTDAPATTERLVPITNSMDVNEGDIVEVVTSDIYLIAPRGTRGVVRARGAETFTVERLDNQERHRIDPAYFGYVQKVVTEPVAADGEPVVDAPLTFHGFAIGDRVRLTRSWDGVPRGSLGAVSQFDGHGTPGGSMRVQFDEAHDGGAYGGGCYIATDYDVRGGTFEKIEPAPAVADPFPAVGHRIRVTETGNHGANVTVGDLGTLVGRSSSSWKVRMDKHHDPRNLGYDDAPAFDYYLVESGFEQAAEPAPAVETPAPAVETFTAEQVAQQVRDAKREVRAEYERNIEELKRNVARHAMEAAREHDWCSVVRETLRDAGIDPDVYCQNPLVEFTITRTYTVRARASDGSTPDVYDLRSSCDSLNTDGELEFDDDLEDVEITDIDDRFSNVCVVDED
jgi:hypothetical protein